MKKLPKVKEMSIFNNLPFIVMSILGSMLSFSSSLHFVKFCI